MGCICERKSGIGQYYERGSTAVFGKWTSGKRVEIAAWRIREGTACVAGRRSAVTDSKWTFKRDGHFAGADETAADYHSECAKESGRSQRGTCGRREDFGRESWERAGTDRRKREMGAGIYKIIWGTPCRNSFGESYGRRALSGMRKYTSYKEENCESWHRGMWKCQEKKKKHRKEIIGFTERK